MVAKILIGFALIALVFFGLFRLSILKANEKLVFLSLLATPCLILLFSIWCILKRGEGSSTQYIFFLLLAVFWLGIDIMSGYKCKLLLAILVITSLRYYNRKLTWFVYGNSVAALLASVWCNAYLYREIGILDLNTVRVSGVIPSYLTGFLYDNVININPDSGALFVNGMVLTFLPNILFLTGITFVAFRFMKYNLRNIVSAETVAAAGATQRMELIDLKTKVMLSQVKPHFVYNTLSSIAMLCTKDPKQAKELTLDFSEYLRNHLDTLGSDQMRICTFSEELEHIKTYLSIESFRFADRLKVVFDVPFSDFEVPVLSIQPLVENAVKHGICPKTGGGTVTISSEKADGGYWIRVKDDGVGFDPERIREDGNVHIGLANIQKRIAMVHGCVTVESTPNVGTTVSVFVKETEG